MKAWIYENSGVKFADHVPFLDSKIVQAMICKDSYGFNTFAGLRVGEIQQKTDMLAWRHVPSKENIADVLTHGAPPSLLGPGSVWYSGPKWLTKDKSEWPASRSGEDKSIELNDDEIQSIAIFAHQSKKLAGAKVTNLVTGFHRHISSRVFCSLGSETRISSQPRSATLVSSAKSEKEFLNYFKEDNIGVDCNPKCGGYRCGQCPIGAKPMSLKDEAEYERFKSNLSYEEHGTAEDPSPYWRTSYPWNIDQAELENNVGAVYCVMNATKRKLQKDPLWEEICSEEDLREKLVRKS